MVEKKIVQKPQPCIKGYTANQSVNSRDGFNAVQSVNAREGYNAQPMAQARGVEPPKAQKPSTPQKKD